MKYDESFGIIPLRYVASSGWEVFLIQHAKGKYWGFPKGHAEGGETNQQAALRELKEETNLDIIRFLSEKPFIEQYQFQIEGKKVLKQVFYFAAEVGGKVILQPKEIQNGAWLSLPQARETLTHKEGKNILALVEKIL